MQLCEFCPQLAIITNLFSIMNSSSAQDYAETFKKRENKELTKRLKKTKNALMICSAIFLLGGILFLFMSGAGNFKNYLLHFVAALVYIILAGNSRKKPFSSILFGMLLVGFLWVITVLLKDTEVLLRESLLNIFALSVLAFAIGTAREAEIIKKNLYLS